jgi:hypothetical protein
MFASERILLLRCLPGNSMVGISSVLWLTISPRSVLIKPFHVPGLLKKSPNHFLIVPRPGFRALTDNLTTFSNPFSGAFRTLINHRENIKKFGSCPLRSKTLVFPGFAAYWANCFGFPAYPCMSMPAGAASSRALPWTLVSRRVSRQSRFRTLIFLGKTYCFVAEVQDSN